MAKGLQYVDVWKNSNELGKMAGSAALQLCAGKTFDQITVPEGLDPTVATMPAGSFASDFVTPGLDGKPARGDENTVKSFIFTPTPITADNLDLVLTGHPLDHQGQALRGRRRRDGSGRLQVALTLAS